MTVHDIAYKRRDERIKRKKDDNAFFQRVPFDEEQGDAAVDFSLLSLLYVSSSTFRIERVFLLAPVDAALCSKVHASIALQFQSHILPPSPPQQLNPILRTKINHNKREKYPNYNGDNLINE